jgi:cytochrome P450
MLTESRINNNAHFIAFWMFSHLFVNPALLKTVREETDACCTDDGACDLNKLVSDSPHLLAVWQESLRFYNAGTTVRKATGDCNIGGKHIHDGDQIFGPIRNFALRQDFFGGDSHEFNAYRWLQNPNLVRSKGYLPFGGGHTYCPGRYFAQREIFMFIALTLRRFDIRVTTAEGVPVEQPKAPPIRVDLPSPGAIAPNEDVFITMSERQL